MYCRYRSSGLRAPAARQTRGVFHRLEPMKKRMICCTSILKVRQASLIWDSYSVPFAWVYDEAVWTREIPNLSKELHYIAQRAFHQL